MDINYKKFPCSEADAVIIPLFEGKVEVPNEETNRFLDLIKAKGQFKGAKGEVISFIRDLGGNLQDAIITGLGKEEELSNEAIRAALSKAVRKAKELKDKKIFVKIPENSKLSYYETSKAIVEGLGLGAYSFEKYKSKDESIDLSFSLAGRDISEEETDNINEAIEEARVLVEAVEIARDLVNEPANALYPRTLAEKTKTLGDTYGFEVEIKEDEEIEALGMEAFLTVARGSKNNPKLIVMRYYGDDNNKDKVLGLVGKGLTYDSGGYSLKPSSGMETMKSDMGGAAAVIGTMISIASRKLKTNVIAVVAACENMISGDAYKPGDIIGSMAGKKIEVINTDAEGRLTLADAVTYIISKEGVNEVIDVATLTGAALVALGTTTTAVITNNNEFFGELSAASEYSGERVWQLPCFPEYKKLIKSDIADLKNTGGRYAGTITAGLFIGEFVEDKPWMHLDIAGTAWNDSARDYSPKGGTGEPLRTLFELLKRRASK